MPITLPPISRRRFLADSLVSGAALLASGPLSALAENIAADHFALMADTHINADPGTTVGETNMFQNLRQAIDEVLQHAARPGRLFIGGDCAHLTGQADDYKTLLRLLTPAREAGLPIHLALGNHDHRQRFWAAFSQNKHNGSGIDNRHVAVVASPRANWFVLDSLVKTNYTPGRLGDAQLAWLAKSLDARADKPAIVILHHNPDTSEKTSGLTDTAALYKVVAPRRHVKAVFFGHTHFWHVRQHDDIHWINLPPVAYVFAPGKPNGWVHAQLTDQGMTIQLHCIDHQHKDHGQTLDLPWRA